MQLKMGPARGGRTSLLTGPFTRQYPYEISPLYGQLACVQKTWRAAIADSRFSSTSKSEVNTRSPPPREQPYTTPMTRVDGKGLDSLPKREATFIEPMECLAVTKPPNGSQWLWELKLDGYRAIAVKAGQDVSLYSRAGKHLDKKFPYIVQALQEIPTGTVLDGEIVALDDSGRPSFNLLQDFGAEVGRVRYFIFNLLCYRDRDLTHLPLI
jgi:ATP-dependent DNA ligase